MNFKKVIVALLLGMSFLGTYAQKAYTIYPVPHSQHVLSTKATFTSAVNIVADKDIDAVTLARAKQILADHGLSAVVNRLPAKNSSNLFLCTSKLKKSAGYKQASSLNLSSLAMPGKFDRHILSLFRYGSGGFASVVIVGENTDATFCGLASLEQILDKGTKNLPCVEIHDYADTQYRGIVEGYYGVPYNEDVTKDIFHFMARYKMNSYMYGAKSDPYHSQKWAEAYPDSITPEQKAIGFLSAPMMKEITSEAKQNKVNFIWAIHPGSAFTENADNHVIDRIMDKFQKMYGLGVRQFGVFVDDVGVPQDDATLERNAQRLTEVQQAVEKKWNKGYTNAADTVKPIHFVPQLYAYSWFDSTMCKRFYTALSHTPKHVVVYITGAKVWSVPNSHDLAVVTKSFGRPVAWWWNYPCNDNDVTKLFVRDTYTNFADEKWIDKDDRLPADLKGTIGILSNPMQQGEASKIALFSVADYSWNHAGFDNEASYQASIKALFRGNDLKAKHFDLLARQLTYFDHDNLLATSVASLSNKNVRQNVLERLNTLLSCCSEIKKMEHSKVVSDSLLYADIRPWVEKVSDMAFLGMQMVKVLSPETAGQSVSDVEKAKLIELNKDLDTNPKYQFGILSGMGSDIILKHVFAEPSAKTLRPFLNRLSEALEKK